MKWIGLTGGIGTGKSTVAELFRALGAPVIDADQISHEVTAPGSQGETKILEVFGDRLPSRTSLDRKALREIVFSDSLALSQLESIVHPLVRARSQELREQLAANGNPYAIYDVPLLFEAGLSQEFDLILVVSCEREVQIKRVTERDGVSRESVEAILQAQIDINIKEQSADIVIFNNGNMHDLEQNIVRVDKQLLGLPSP